MRRLLVSAGVLALSVVSARAELAVGDVAPPVQADGVRAGVQVPFVLAEALKQGPVILYFYPQGPSETCYVENYEFTGIAERLDKQGISVLGVSSDKLANVMQTSRQECSDKLTLASDPANVLIKSYAAQNPQRPGYALSVGYVIAPTGRIIYARRNDAKDAVEHVADMVQAAEGWIASQKP